MDIDGFDRATRALAPVLTRRGLSGLVALAAFGTTGVVDARKKRRKKKKKKGGPDKRQVQFNAFGCVNVGNFCESPSQCCSGICQGSTCQGHDVDVCQAGQTALFCSEQGTDAVCTSQGGGVGLCGTTTGNAGFCVSDRKCFACTKDTDCQPATVCGVNAACIACANCDAEGGTACVTSATTGCA